MARFRMDSPSGVVHAGCPSSRDVADGKHDHCGYSPLDHGSEKRWRKNCPINHDSASRCDVLNCRPVISRTGHRMVRVTSVAGFRWTRRSRLRLVRWRRVILSGALKRVALRDDAPALALRGIAMAQLGDLVRAKALLRGAARAFGQKEAVARARCVVAEAEIRSVSRDLGWPAKSARRSAGDA